MRYRLLGTWCCYRAKLFHVEQFGFYGMPAVGTVVHSPPALNCSTWNNLAFRRFLWWMPAFGISALRFASVEMTKVGCWFVRGLKLFHVEQFGNLVQHRGIVPRGTIWDRSG